MYYLLGRNAAFDALGVDKYAYDLNDAGKVLAAAKKYVLPKGANRTEIMPKIMDKFVPPNAIPSAAGLKGDRAAISSFLNKVPEAEYYLGPVRQATHPNNPELKPLSTLTQGFTRPAIIKGDSNPASYMTAMSEGPRPKLEPNQYKMLHSIIRGHELDELAVTPQAAFRPMGHRSPDVLLREHNRVTTLPEGYDPVKNIMKDSREPLEAAALKDLLGSNFDYGESPRFSRHARKRITSMMEDGTAKATQDALRANSNAMQLSPDDIG